MVEVAKRRLSRNERFVGKEAGCKDQDCNWNQQVREGEQRLGYCG